MKTILLYGLRRSGNHFIISAIMQHYKNYVHINDTILSYDEYNKYKNIYKTVNSIDSEYTGFKGVDCVIISMENKIINYQEIEKFKNEMNIFTLILLRNPYCHLSSAWRIYNKNEILIANLINLWQLYAKEFINNNNNNLIKILYDEFVINNEYVTSIFNKLGINKISFDKNHYITYQESSFVNPEYSKKIYQNLDECVYGKDIDFIKLFEKKEIDELWNKVLSKIVIDII